MQTTATTAISLKTLIIGTSPILLYRFFLDDLYRGLGTYQLGGLRYLFLDEYFLLDEG